MVERRKRRIPKNVTPRMVWEMFYANEDRIAENEKRAAESRAEDDRKRAEWEKKREEDDRKRAADREAWEKKLADDKAKDEAAREKKREEDQAAWEKKRAEDWAAWEVKFEREKAEWNEKMGTVNKKLGETTNTFGEVIENLMIPGVEACFNKLGFTFQDDFPERKFRDEDGKIIAEVDLLLEGKDTVIVVEAKSKPTGKHVLEQVEKMKKLRPWFDRRMPGKRVLCAITGAVFGKAQRQAALNAGFYVVIQSGDLVKMDIPEGFVPKAW